MDSDIFFHGIKEGEIGEVKVDEGKILVIKLMEIRDPDENGNRELTFQVNGLMRTILVKDKDAMTKATKQSIIIADADNDLEIGANIPGNIVKVLVKEGEKVTASQPIAVIEAMKMETPVKAEKGGTVVEFLVAPKEVITAGQAIVVIEEK